MLKVKNDIDRAEIYISGTIVDDEDGAAQSTDGYEFPRAIRQQLEQCRGLPLTVYINSYGGSVNAGIAMANMLARHDAETTAIVDGVCASIATQIFFSADKCRMPANAYLFIHAPTSAVEGTAEEMNRAAEALKVVTEGLLTTYLSKARETTTEDELRAMLESERWLTGTEAAQLFNIELMSATQTVNCKFPRGKLHSRMIPPMIRFTNDERRNKMTRVEELKQEIEATKLSFELLREQAAINDWLQHDPRSRKPTPTAVEELRRQGFSPLSSSHFEPNTRPQTDAQLRNRAFNKLVFRSDTLTDAERRAYFNESSGTSVSPAMVEGTPSKGGYLVPVEQIAAISEHRKAYTALKDFCHVIPVNSMTGTLPTLGAENGTLIDFSELEEIQRSDLDLGQVEYHIRDYGDIIPISNQLLADVNVNLIGIIGQRFAKKCVNTENEVILALLQSTLTPTPLSNYKQLMKAFYVDLDPVHYADAKIFTNQDGFNWLSTLEDENKRPLMQPDVTAPDTFLIRGKQLVVLSNGTLKTTAGKAPIFIGSLADYALFFDRAGVEVAISTDAMFIRNTTAIRAIERFAVSADDTNAMKAYQVTVG